MESPKFRAFCLADPVVFESPARLGDADTLFDQSLRPVPPGWRRAQHGLWTMFLAEGTSLPPQGWKIHLSVTVSAATEVLDLVWDYCLSRRLAFKFLRSRAAMIAVNAKEGSRGGSGKFVTIYPLNNEQLSEVLPEVSELLASFVGPYVLSDLRYGAGPAYVRYGAFAEMYCAGDDGEPTPALRAPDGTLIPDLRGAVFSVPGWVTIPDVLGPSLAARAAGAGDDFPYSVNEALQFSNSGGIYLATDRATGERVVLREARPHAGLDRYGSDAVARLERERTMLTRLSGLECVPRLLGCFTAWEHHFLVEEYIEGQTLLAAVIERYPLAHPHPSACQLDEYRAWTVEVTVNVERALEAIHGRGVRFGDLHPGNVLVRPDGRVALVDFELAADIGEACKPGLGAPGFIAPPELSGAEIDRYAMECLRLFMLLPLVQLLGRDRAKARTLVEVAGRIFPGAPRPVLASPGRPTSTGSTAAPDRDLGAELFAGTTPDWPAIRDSLVAGIHASATPDRTDRLFPGDPNQFVTGGIAMRSGAAGVLLALHQVGAGVPAEYVDWLAGTARLERRYVRGGLYDGLHGVALALDVLGRPDDALEILDLAQAERDESSAVGVLGGGAGVALTLLHFADRTGDARYRRAAARITQDLAALLTDEPARANSRRPSKAGLMRGMTGPAMLFLRRYETSEDPHDLDLARAALLRDLHRCAELPDGTRQVHDGSTYLSYLDDGSAGIAVVLQQYLHHREDPALARALEQIRHACHPQYVFQPGLFRGRAGFIAVLCHLAVPDDEQIVRDHVRRLGWHALRYRGHLAFPGTSLLRISMDLATGSAGILLALHAAFEETAVILPFPGARRLSPARPHPKGGDFHVVRA
jgi:serine/threonine protein kinase